ncbi:hypothetical protein K438DRAFT_2144283 [Mycena galopus ATCC 62051]|nr:hypothetical protein K438DRAFT_2144283 [Mycena galopus ATCC 62051]
MSLADIVVLLLNITCDSLSTPSVGKFGEYLSICWKRVNMQNRLRTGMTQTFRPGSSLRPELKVKDTLILIAEILQDHSSNSLFQNSPYEVRAVVDNHDDRTISGVTFRAFVIGTIFVAAGGFINQFFSIRSSRYPTITVYSNCAQVLAFPAAKLMELQPRSTRISAIRGPSRSTRVNGKFNPKEHMLITVSAAKYVSIHFKAWARVWPTLGSVRVGRFDVSEVVSGVVSDVVSEVVSENCWHQKRGKKRPWIYLAGETTSETMQKLLRRSFYIVSEVFLVSPTL